MKQSCGFFRLVALVALVLSAAIARAQLAPTYSDASLRGTYAAITYKFASGTAQTLTPATGVALPPPLGFKSQLGTATFDGAGNFTLTFTQDFDGVIISNPSSGTYSVASNGALTITSGPSGIVLQNGRLALVSALTAGQDPQIAVLVREENTAGDTAVGANALSPSTTGIENTAYGAYSLAADTTGSTNAATGYAALTNNTTGANNNAVGFEAMYSNQSGNNNNAQGGNALYNNLDGYGNSAMGFGALYSDVHGFRNVAVGNNAGYSILGNYNIDIGWDVTGTAGDNGVIRIGSQGVQSSTYIGGIYGTNVSGGQAVYVTSTGQLVTQGSSERFKTDIATMPDLSTKLAQLHPVTFHYKTDPTGVLQYGLIAEEVAKVYPELVIQDDAGKIQGVRYEELAPMLLNEVQQLRKQVAELKQLVSNERVAIR